MKLLADESVDSPIVERLRQDGHSVFYIAELDPGIDGRADELLYAFSVISPGRVRIRRHAVNPDAEA